MKYTKYIAFFLMPLALIADCLRDYTQLTNSVHKIIHDVRRALPEHTWSARFQDLCRSLDEDVIPCSCLRYLIEECSSVIDDPKNKLEHLKKMIQACCTRLDKAPYEIPQLSEQSIQKYRACCKRRRCLIIDQDLAVGNTITTNNFVETGIASFLNTPQGNILGYAYLYAQNASTLNEINSEQFVQFDMIAGTTKFINSPQFSLSETSPGSNIVDGINVPAGTYLFYWKVMAHNDDDDDGTPIILELSSSTAGSLLGTKFSSDVGNPAGEDSIYVNSGGAGIIVLSQASTLRILNPTEDDYTIPTQPVVQKLLALVRIQG